MFKQLRQKIAETIYPEGPRERRGLERLTEVDELTGLGNKRALMKALPAAELDPEVAVLIFDMNNLGRANKCDGHGRGDALIRRAARTIQVFTKQLTGQCRAFRFGGDEFVVFCDKAYAHDLVYVLRNRFNKHYLTDGTVVSLAGSVGNTLAEADERLQPCKIAQKQHERVV